MADERFRFEPARYARELEAIITEIDAAPEIDARGLDRILRRHPKQGRGFFAKSEILSGARHLARRGVLGVDPAILARRLRTCPTRTRSGIVAVTVLTRPHPCPGRCVFCPSDARMPKSYLASEPGAQRAATHAFDPYRQTHARIRALDAMGHRVDKVELIVLGGTWSSYPEAYRIGFLRACFDALSDYTPAEQGGPPFQRQAEASGWEGLGDFARLPASAAGRYNATVSSHLRKRLSGGQSASFEAASWNELERAQQRNQTAQVRCVGLSLETRPDEVDEAEVLRLRRMGATKLQLGIQSLSDEVLRRNRRGHDVATTRFAMRLLRAAGFKIQVHWMANLLGSDPDADLADFERLFADPALRPDELKLYPTSLVESAELMAHYRSGEWRPYDDDELLRVVTGCLRRAPRYCRLTRVVRDIPSPEIVVGNKHTNFREIAERDLQRRGIAVMDIRAREIRGNHFDVEALRLRETRYANAVGEERFLEWVTPEDRIVGFLRLSLPDEPSFVSELGGSAVIRELHVYGDVAGLGEAAQGRAQHAGLGRRLVEAAASRARAAGFASLAVISAVGTLAYYRTLGFRDGLLYQHLRLEPDPPARVT